MIAPVFFLLLMATVEVGVIFFAQSSLQNAVNDVARMVRTGQTNCFSTGLNNNCVAITQQQFRTQICNEVSASCSRIAAARACNSTSTPIPRASAAPPIHRRWMSTTTCPTSPISTSAMPAKSCWYAPSTNGRYSRRCLISSCPIWRAILICCLPRRHSAMNPTATTRRVADEELAPIPQSPERGLAAVEFALLLPVMITMFFGVVELSLALLCRADVSIMASTAADLIAQESTTQTSDHQQCLQRRRHRALSLL